MGTKRVHLHGVFKTENCLRQSARNLKGRTEKPPHRIGAHGTNAERTRPTLQGGHTAQSAILVQIADPPLPAMRGRGGWD